MIYDKDKVQTIREKYPVGTKIVIEKMDDVRAIQKNHIGIVKNVDDCGTIHCVFDDGRVLGVIENLDDFRIIK